MERGSMYIIDKNKDYYDYFSHIYGIDKKIVYNRRGSKDIYNIKFAKICYKYHLSYKGIEHILLEIGYKQYIFQLSKFKTIESHQCTIVNDYEIELVKTYSDHKHYFDSPVSLHGVTIKSIWGFKYNENIRYLLDRPYSEAIVRTYKEINNPILANTKITSFLEALTVWIEIQTYISSLDNDKDVDLNMSDVEKAEIHGFDKKTSFRNPIK
jgi:hypothetical protein